MSIISSQTTLLLCTACAPNESMTWDFRTMQLTALPHFEHKNPTLMTSIIDWVFIDICLRGRMSLPTMQREFFMDMVSFFSVWSFTFFKLVARVRTNLSAVSAVWRNEGTVLYILEFVHAFIMSSFPNILSSYDFHNPQSRSLLLWSSIGRKNYVNPNEPVGILSRVLPESKMIMATECLKQHPLLQYQHCD